MQEATTIQGGKSESGRTAPRLRLGTRGSPLALAQAAETAERLRAAWPELAEEGAIETVVVRTTGDRVRDRPLAEIGGKALFAKEIEAALLAGEIDLAVHSLKDLPSQLPEAFALAAVLPREDPRDTLVLAQGRGGLESLPQGGLVGTCSPRRAAQLLMRRPDLRIQSLRGNVDTRLAKLREGEMAATLLAQAGLNRMDLKDLGQALAPEDFLPAATQGAIGLEIRRGDDATARLLAKLNHEESWRRAVAERACLAAMNASCYTPIAALATVAGERLTLDALFLLPDGSHPLQRQVVGATGEAAALGDGLGRALCRDASPAHLALLED